MMSKNVFDKITSILSGGHLGAVTARFRYFDEWFEKSSVSNTNLKREQEILARMAFLV